MIETLPDLLADGVRLVLVGINPSSFSVAQGHYFARPQNRFWPAFSLSRLSLPIRTGLAVERLEPHHDVALPGFGIGLTDLVKRHSPNASTLSDADYRDGAASLLLRLQRYRPAVVCFHGMMAFRPFIRYGLGHDSKSLVLGRQSLRFGDAALFVLPNPSPANAQYRLPDLVAWYDRLAEALSPEAAGEATGGGRPGPGEG